MPQDTIAFDEWLAELNRLESQVELNRDEWKTTREICQESGLHEKTVLKKLRQLFDAGLLETGKVNHTTMSGYTTKVTAYRLKGKRKQNKS